jgi:hypothetical protein
MEVKVVVQQDEASITTLVALRLVVFGSLKNSATKERINSPRIEESLKTDALLPAPSFVKHRFK